MPTRRAANVARFDSLRVIALGLAISLAASLLDADEPSLARLPSPGYADPAWLELQQQMADLRFQVDMLQRQLAAERDTYEQTDLVSPWPGDASMPAMAASSTAPPSAEAAYPTVKVNGVFQADVGFFGQDAASRAAHGDLQDGADFRRARLSARGAVTETVNYMMQMDFAFAGRPTFTDVWVESTDHPLLGTVRMGQWKQPFSLEVVSSFRYTTFLERSLLFQPFTPFRHLGIGFYDHSEDMRWTWAVSGFRSGQDQFGDSISDHGGWGTAERITWAPWYDEMSHGRGYLHLGAAHYLSLPPGHSVNFRTIPELFIGDHAAGAVGTSGQALPGAINGTPFFVATGPLPVEYFNVVGTEVLLVCGRFSVQAEGMVCQASQQLGPHVTLPGMYAQVGYFLTGEHRPYDRRTGSIDRVAPFENFFRVGADDGTYTGWGAWELAFRVSTIDLNDANVAGGSLTDLTAGVNWYWNPYTKLVFNYIHAQTQSPVLGQNQTDLYAARAQVDF